jgi:hypothetical protein
VAFSFGAQNASEPAKLVEYRQKTIIAALAIFNDLKSLHLSDLKHSRDMLRVAMSLSFDLLTSILIQKDSICDENAREFHG